MSRKLTESQQRTWDLRDNECYAIISALEKWAGWIGLQQVVILTDHEALENWTTEVLETPSGISGHQKVSRFNLTVEYIKREGQRGSGRHEQIRLPGVPIIR